MKISSQLVILACAALALSGCNALNSIGKKNNNTISGAEAVSAGTSTTKVKGSGTSKPSKKQATTAKVTDDAYSQLAGQWVIFQVGSTTIDRDEDMPYIIFDTTDKAFYANNGCNTLNGSYTINQDGRMSFHNVLSTMRLCPDVEFEGQINEVISEKAPVRYAVEKVGNESFFEFLDKNGKALMRMRRGDIGFLNGQWDVESIRGLEKLEVPANIFFDLTEKTLHGNTGCNIVNGDIYMDHRMANAIDFSNMLTTRMACPYDTQQTAMLVALEETASVISDGRDKAMLLDANGQTLMTLRRASQVYED